MAVRNQDLLEKQEASGILSSVGFRTPLIKIPVLGDIFFKKFENNV